MSAILLATALRTISFTLPMAVGLNCQPDSLAHSYMHAQVAYLPRRTMWAPLDWRVWAAEGSLRYILTTRDTLRGSKVVVTFPDTLMVGSLMVRACGPGGCGCWSNIIASSMR